jgi:co-chaperonin GroES (HSP10)
MSIRPTQDNVFLVIEPDAAVTASGIHLVNDGKKARLQGRVARVVASGPGYYRTQRQMLGNRTYSAPTEVFIPNETKPGDRVIVDASSHQDYRLDLNIPRHNLSAEFKELLGEKGEFLAVREEEILAVLEPAP